MNSGTAAAAASRLLLPPGTKAGAAALTCVAGDQYAAGFAFRIVGATMHANTKVVSEIK